MKGCSTFPKGAVSIFYSPSQLGKIVLSVTGVTRFNASRQNSSGQNIEHKQIKCLSSGYEIQSLWSYNAIIRKMTSHWKVKDSCLYNISWTRWLIDYIRKDGRCPWCHGYRHRKWTRLIAFHIALIPLGKVWIQLFSLQLWVNSRAD